MPTEYLLLGAVLVIIFGVLIFILIGRHKPTEPPHFR